MSAISSMAAQQQRYVDADTARLIDDLDALSPAVGHAYFVDEVSLATSALTSVLADELPNEDLDEAATATELVDNLDQVRASYITLLSDTEQAAAQLSTSLIYLLAAQRSDDLRQIRSLASSLRAHTEARSGLQSEAAAPADDSAPIADQVRALRDLLEKGRSQGEADPRISRELALYEDNLRVLSDVIRSAVFSWLVTHVNEQRQRDLAPVMTLSVSGQLYARSAGEHVQRTELYDDVEALLDTRPEGGSFGIAGPRGAGKTTLMDYLVARANRSRRMGLTSQRLSVPVSYDAREFVIHLYSLVLQDATGVPPADVAQVWRSLSAQLSGPRRVAGRALAAAVAGAGVAMCVYAVIRRIRFGSTGVRTADIALGAAVATGVLAGYLLSLARTWGWQALKRFDVSSVGISRGTVTAAGLFAAASAAGVAVFLLAGGWRSETWLIVFGLATMGAGLGTWFGPLSVPEFHDTERLSDIRRQVELQYQVQYTSERSASASLGFHGATFGLAGKRGTGLSLLPRTYPQLVAEFREFLAVRLAQARGGYGEPVGPRMIVGIDELDKITDATQAYQFLNDVKAIFDVPGCAFLVSVSDDAAANFQRKGVPFRDALDSAFDDIVVVSPPSVRLSEKLLRGLAVGWTDPFVEFCHVWAGGRVRDLIRVAREVAETPADEDGTIHLGKAVELIAGRDFGERVGAVRRELLALDRTADVLDLLGTLEELDRRSWARADVARCVTRMRDWLHASGRIPETPAAHLARELQASALVCVTAMDYFVAEPPMPRVELRELVHDGLARAVRLRSGAPAAAITACEEFRQFVGLAAVVADGAGTERPVA